MATIELSKEEQAMLAGLIEKLAGFKSYLDGKEELNDMLSPTMKAAVLESDAGYSVPDDEDDYDSMGDNYEDDEDYEEKDFYDADALRNMFPEAFLKSTTTYQRHGLRRRVKKAFVTIAREEDLDWQYMAWVVENDDEGEFPIYRMDLLLTKWLRVLGREAVREIERVLEEAVPVVEVVEETRTRLYGSIALVAYFPGAFLATTTNFRDTTFLRRKVKNSFVIMANECGLHDIWEEMAWAVENDREVLLPLYKMEIFIAKWNNE